MSKTRSLQDMEVKQEFMHVATREGNIYIEGNHSIQQLELLDRFTLSSFYDVKQHIEKYMHWYNCKRRHGTLNGLTPMQKWTQGSLRSTDRQQFEPASADLTRPDRSVSQWEGSALYSLDKANETAYLRLSGEQDEQLLVSNLFEKTVQVIGG